MTHGEGNLRKKYIIINNRFCSPQLLLIFSAESAVLIASELSYHEGFLLSKLALNGR